MLQNIALEHYDCLKIFTCIKNAVHPTSGLSHSAIQVLFPCKIFNSASHHTNKFKNKSVLQILASKLLDACICKSFEPRHKKTPDFDYIYIYIYVKTKAQIICEVTARIVHFLF